MLHHTHPQSTIGRSNVQRAFRIEDGDSIMAHLPFIAARIASESPASTAEELVEIMRKVRQVCNADRPS